MEGNCTVFSSVEAQGYLIAILIRISDKKLTVHIITKRIKGLLMLFEAGPYPEYLLSFSDHNMFTANRSYLILFIIHGSH